MTLAEWLSLFWLRMDDDDRWWRVTVLNLWRLAKAPR